jgi:hypothetical protein
VQQCRQQQKPVGNSDIRLLLINVRNPFALELGEDVKQSKIEPIFILKFGFVKPAKIGDFLSKSEICQIKL